LDRTVARESRRWRLQRTGKPDPRRQRKRGTVRRKQTGHADSLAEDSSSVVSGRLRNLLCGHLSEGDPTGAQSQLLGFVDRVQVLVRGDGRHSPVLTIDAHGMMWHSRSWVFPKWIGITMLFMTLYLSRSNTPKCSLRLSNEWTCWGTGRLACSITLVLSWHSAECSAFCWRRGLALT
jgi:hypothetical protein